MELHTDICMILSFSCYTDVFSLVKCIDHGLLYFFVKLCIQRIDFDHFIKDLRIPLSDLGHRIGNDRKASLFPFDIFIGKLSGAAVILESQFPLLIRIGRSFRHLLWRKRSLPECLHHSRSCKLSSQPPVLFIHSAHNFQPALDVTLIHKKSLVLTVIILVLPVSDRAVIADLMVLPLRDHTGCRPVNDRFQAHLPKIIYGSPDHFLKAQIVPDIDYGFL